MLAQHCYTLQVQQGSSPGTMLQGRSLGTEAVISLSKQFFSDVNSEFRHQRGCFPLQPQAVQAASAPGRRASHSHGITYLFMLVVVPIEPLAAWHCSCERISRGLERHRAPAYQVADMQGHTGFLCPFWRLKSGFVQRDQLPIARLHLQKSAPSLQSKSQALNLNKMTTRWVRRRRLYRTLYAGWSENYVLKLP